MCLQVDLSVNLLDVAKETDGFSGSDLREMCRDAALLCVRDFVHTQSDRYSDKRQNATKAHVSFHSLHVCLSLSPSEDFIRPIHQSDLEKAIGKMKKSKMAGGHSALLHAALD